MLIGHEKQNEYSLEQFLYTNSILPSLISLHNVIIIIQNVKILTTYIIQMLIINKFVIIRHINKMIIQRSFLSMQYTYISRNI